MAKDAKSAEGADAAPPKKSKKLLIIIASVLVLVLAAGGGAAFFLMKKNAAEDGEEGEVVTEKAKDGKKKDAKETAPVYVALDAFTVNLAPETPDSAGQYLQLVLSVEVADVHVGDRIKMYTPKIRNNVMLLLSGKKASELITREGKEALAGDIRTLLNKVLDPAHKGGDGPVKDILFTAFIIQ